MEDSERLIAAKTYLEKLANGINPLNDSVIPDEEIINNVRISRCLFYVTEVLEDVISGVYKKKPKRREVFNLSYEELERFPFSETPLMMKEITERLDSLIDTRVTRRISSRFINQWLLSIGLLKWRLDEYGGKEIKVKEPTQTGRDIGIITEERSGVSGEKYEVLLYTRKAQQFIVDNIKEQLDLFGERNELIADNASMRGTIWTKNEEMQLLEEYVKKQYSIGQIALIHGRGVKAIRSRLRKLGAIIE